MDLPQVLQEIQAQAVTLTLSGEKLRYKAPGSVPVSIVDLIREHKPALIQHLKASHDPPLEPEPQNDVRRRTSLDDLQRLLTTGQLDGRRLVVNGYSHPDIGQVVRQYFGHMDNAQAEGLNPGYFQNLLREVARALDSEAQA